MQPLQWLEQHTKERSSSKSWVPKRSCNDSETDASTARAAVWESCLKFDRDGTHMKVSMSHQALTDADMEEWSSWFESYLQQSADPYRAKLVASNVDFAENRLTEIGVERLLETFQANKVGIQILKLHHNCIQSGTAIANLIVGCNGVLRELHLSHNELGTAAAADIILAAASAKDAQGVFSYPQAVQGDVAAPLWLRLDLNRLDHARLQERLRPGLQNLGRADWALCDARGMGCKPRCCEWHHRDPPPVHAKHLTHQRGKAATAAEPGAAVAADYVESSVGDCYSEPEVATSESDQSTVYSKETMLVVRHMLRDVLHILKDGPSLIKQIKLPKNLDSDRWSEGEKQSDEGEISRLEDATFNPYDIDPDMFPTWEEFMETIGDDIINWSWSEPRISGSAPMLSTEPQASEYAQLLSILRRSPEGIVSLSSLQDLAPALLKGFVQDAATLREWLQQCMGTVEVFGPEGAELVAIKQANEQPSSMIAEQPQAPKGGEGMQFNFNVQAADFVPGQFANLNPDAAEFVPGPKTSASSSGSSQPQEDSFSDEEEKLLGAQLCRDLAEFGASPASPGSAAQTSAGEEELAGSEETEEEEEHIAFATAAAIIA